jgi:hypothetical protein
VSNPADPRLDQNLGAMNADVDALVEFHKGLQALHGGREAAVASHCAILVAGNSATALAAALAVALGRLAAVEEGRRGARS